MTRAPWIAIAWMTSACAVAVLTCCVPVASAQDAPKAKKKKQLRADLLTTVPSNVQAEETFVGPATLKEFPANISSLEYTPNFEEKTNTLFERSKRGVLRHGVWGLEFSFKPLRMVEIDMPQPEGRMKRKLIWYLVYRVRNVGGHLAPKTKDGRKETVVAEEDPALAERYRQFDVDKVNEMPAEAGKIHFRPQFALRAHEFENKEYLDKVVPAAMEAIAKREQIDKFAGKQLLDSIAIGERELALSDENNDNSLWGVATWEDVDPRIDYFSIAVQGLTSAIRYEEKTPPKKGQRSGENLTFTNKQLILHFWRPGDTVAQHEGEIRFGFPTENNPEAEARALKFYGVPARIDHYWTYR